MSSLSYRKRATLKDSIGGQGDEETLFSTLSERPASPDRSFRKAKRSGVDEGGSVASWKKLAGADDLEERGSVLPRSFSEAGSQAPKGLEKRWSASAAEFDKASVLSAPLNRSGASWCGREDDARSSLSFALSSPGSLRRSTSRLDDLSPSYSRPGSRLSLGCSQLDDAASVALSDSRSLYSQHSLSRSLSVPPRPRASDEPRAPEDPDIRPVGHRSYLDPDLEAAITEVLNYKPAKFKRSSLDPDSEDEDDRKSVRSSRSAALRETAERPASSLRRSASALDFSRPHSAKGKSRQRSSSSSSSSSSPSPERPRKSSKKHGKKAKKSKRKKQPQPSGSSSESSSSSTSSGSCRSNSSIKKGPKRGGRPLEGGEDAVATSQEGREAGKSSKQRKKEEKQRKKAVDSLMMKYLYRPESD